MYARAKYRSTTLLSRRTKTASITLLTSALVAATALEDVIRFASR
jgi:hypothetical protein